jgi:hypothetical protein
MGVETKGGGAMGVDWMISGSIEIQPPIGGDKTCNWWLQWRALGSR